MIEKTWIVFWPNLFQNKKYTGLSFTLEYSEGGVGFRGIFEGQNGEVLQNNCWDMTREDMIELGYLDEDEDEETA
ncbi:hypothetical protein FACS1894110_02060 [Spirochaetia bacterium]|nr:hypothetical protein FACS1894110_02060 [Spirochaetia bacterium]